MLLSGSLVVVVNEHMEKNRSVLLVLGLGAETPKCNSSLF